MSNGRAVVNYHEYLKSMEWAQQRRSALFFAGNRCQVCNGRRNLEVHHRTYERLGNELPEDLTVLCERCHGIYHAAGRLPVPPRDSSAIRFSSAIDSAERRLLMVMMCGVEWVERAGELISAEDFDDPHHRAIFLALLDDPEMRSPPPSMDPVVAKRHEEILSDPEVAHGIDVFTKSVNRIRVSVLDRRIRLLQELTEAAANDDEKRTLLIEKDGLVRERQGLDPILEPVLGRSEGSP